GRVVFDGDRVEVDHAEESLSLRLGGDVLTEAPGIVPEVLRPVGWMPEKMRTVWELSLKALLVPGRQATAGEQQRGQALQVCGAQSERLLEAGRETLLDLT